MLDLGSQSFDTFSLGWYSEEYTPTLGISARENMDWVYNTCRKYAENFGLCSGRTHSGVRLVSFSVGLTAWRRTPN